MTIVFLLSVTAMMAVLGLIHYVVLQTVVSIFAITQPTYLLYLSILFIFLTLSILIALILSSRFGNIIVRGFYKFSCYWIGLLFFLFIASCIYGLALSFGEIILLAGCALALYSAFNSNNVRVTRYEVSLPHLPEEWKGKKAILFSDTHLGHIRGKRFAQKIVKIVNKENPEIILIAGDLYDGVTVDEKDIISPLKNLKAAWGTYFAPGNHEQVHGSLDDYIGSIQGVGIKILMDEKIDVHGVSIIGMDFNTTTVPENFKNVLEKIGVDRNRTNILIKHVPLDLGVSENMGIHLSLSGHTHQAQIFPFSILTKKMYKGYDYGMKMFGKMVQITSSGAGTWGPPYRFLTKAEIVSIVFK